MDQEQNPGKCLGEYVCLCACVVGGIVEGSSKAPKTNRKEQ